MAPDRTDRHVHAGGKLAHAARAHHEVEQACGASDEIPRLGRTAAGTKAAPCGASNALDTAAVSMRVGARFQEALDRSLAQQLADV